jgi:hypothetical protein
VGLGVFGLLGVLNPGLWLVGAGLELAYLFALVNNPRFRKWVDSRLLSSDRKGWSEKVDRLVGTLDTAAQLRYRALEEKCRAMVKDPALTDSAATQQSMSSALGHLVWVYLQLLVTRQATIRLLQDGQASARQRGAGLAERKADLERRLADPGLDGDLRRSLMGQLDLVNQRIEGQSQAREKIDFIDAELIRVEEQIHLVREQAVLAADPDAASRRIDAIQGTLGSTTQWIRDQRKLSGELSEALEGTPPPVFDVGTEQMN